MRLCWSVPEDYKSLSTHASIAAQPAFAANGFSVIREETVPMKDQELQRFEMGKQL